MRLIDADALMRKICGAKCGCEHEDCGMEGDCAFEHFVFWAKAVDAVPVVRCKDCVHYGEAGDCEVHPYDGRFNVNYFCADGKKKA